MSSVEDSLASHGWTAVSRNPNVLLAGKAYINEPSPLLVKDIDFPSDDGLVAKIQNYARGKLSLPTYHHSMRVFFFGEPWDIWPEAIEGILPPPRPRYLLTS